MHFWHSGSSPYLFFNGLLFLSFGIVMIYEPRFLVGASKAYEEAIAHVELDRFSYYEISTQGVLSHATGDKGYRFTHEDIIKGLDLAQFIPEQQKIERLTTDLGIKQGEVLIFPQGVQYTRGGSFSAKKGKYDLKRRYFKGDGEFELIRDRGDRAQGQNIRYDSHKGIVEAEDVHAIFLFQTGGAR